MPNVEEIIGTLPVVVLKLTAKQLSEVIHTLSGKTLSVEALLFSKPLITIRELASEAGIELSELLGGIPVEELERLEKIVDELIAF